MADELAQGGDAQGQAAEWYERLNHTALTAAEMDRFREWRRHKDNEAAFRAVEDASVPPVPGELPGPAGEPVTRIPQPLGLFASELMERAKEYLEAAKKLHAGDGPLLIHPTYFAITHTVELALKAYLAARGTTKRKLRSQKMGHDLAVLQRAAVVADLETVAELDDLIWHLAGINDEHALRYPAGYVVSVPYAHQCIGVIESLLAAIKPAVELAYLKSRMRYLAQYQGMRVVWSD